VDRISGNPRVSRGYILPPSLPRRSVPHTSHRVVATTHASRWSGDDPLWILLAFFGLSNVGEAPKAG